VWEERGTKVFQSRVLRKTFGSKRDEIRGEWKKLHNEGVCDFYSSPNIIGVITSRTKSQYKD